MADLTFFVSKHRSSFSCPPHPSFSKNPGAVFLKARLRTSGNGGILRSAWSLTLISASYQRTFAFCNYQEWGVGKEKSRNHTLVKCDPPAPPPLCKSHLKFLFPFWELNLDDLLKVDSLLDNTGGIWEGRDVTGGHCGKNPTILVSFNKAVAPLFLQGSLGFHKEGVGGRGLY